MKREEKDPDAGVILTEIIETSTHGKTERPIENSIDKKRKWALVKRSISVRMTWLPRRIREWLAA